MDILSICRTCLGLSGPFLSIYAGNGDSNGTLADKLRNFTQSKPKAGDHLPEKVCLTCIGEINRCYSFILKCDNSNRTLRQLIPDALPEEEEEEEEEVHKALTRREKSVSKADKSVQATVATPSNNTTGTQVQAGDMAIMAAVDRGCSPICENWLQFPHFKVKGGSSHVELPCVDVERGNRTRRTAAMAKLEAPCQAQPPKKRCVDNFKMIETQDGEEIFFELHEEEDVKRHQIVYEDQQEATEDVKNPLQEQTDDSDERASYYELSENQLIYNDEIDEADARFSKSKAAPGDDEADHEQYEPLEFNFEVVDNAKQPKREPQQQPDFNFTIYDNDDGEAEIVAEPVASRCKSRARTPKKGEFKCTSCTMSFVSERNLHRHMLKRHGRHETQTEPSNERAQVKQRVSAGGEDTNDTLLEIQIPEKSFEFAEEKPKIATLASAVITTAEEDEEEGKEATGDDAADERMPLYTCDMCHAGFVHRKSLNHHRKLNTCTMRSYKCEECERVFISEQNLREHTATHTLLKSCTECHEEFTTKDELNQHLIDRHNRKSRNQCPECKKVFTMLSALKDHMRVHSGEKPFLCPFCSKGFSQNANLRQHVMRHSQEKKFKCDQCPCNFVTKGEMHSHQRVHTGDKLFKCDQCPASYTTSSSLAKHKRKHTGERPYACEYCPMLFATLNVLKNHRRTHTGEKPFKCSYCGKCFAQKGDCQIHERIHTGEKKYTCVCGEKFNRLALARTHLKTHKHCRDAVKGQSSGGKMDTTDKDSHYTIIDMDDETEMFTDEELKLETEAAEEEAEKIIRIAMDEVY